MFWDAVGSEGVDKPKANLQLRVIVVGDCADEFIRDTLRVLDEYEVDVQLCRDIYDAAGACAANGLARGVVIGRLDELAREQGRFLRIVREGGLACYCLTDIGTKQKRKELTAALASGVSVISDAAEAGGVVGKLLASQTPGQSETTGEMNFVTDIAATRAQLDALLGGQDE